jgi:hypothetical protein
MRVKEVQMIKAHRETGHFHAVRFYRDSPSLCRIVADFLSDGLVSGEPAIVIATQEHAEGLTKSLGELSLDAARLESTGELLLLDANQTLASFMVDGQPDGKLFTTALTRVIDKVCSKYPERTVRAYGEMVNVLWRDGRQDAAIRLETLWNELANSRSFSLLCGYSMGNFYKDAAHAEICRQHTHVVEADDIERSADFPVTMRTLPA